MLPLTKRRIVIVPNGLAAVAAGVCLTFAAFQIAPDDAERLAADTSAGGHQGDQVATTSSAGGAGQDKTGDKTPDTERQRSSGLDFTFFLFPSRP